MITVGALKDGSKMGVRGRSVDSVWTGTFSFALDQNVAENSAAGHPLTYHPLKRIIEPGFSSTTARRLRNTTRSS